MHFDARHSRVALRRAPAPNGASGIVQNTSQTWTFGIPNLCLDTPGTITIHSIALEPPNEIDLVRFGIKGLGPDTDLGIGAVQEPMTDYGYRTAPDPVTITGTCPHDDTPTGTWSLAVEVKPANATLSGAITGMTLTYGTTQSDGATRTFKIPMTLRLCAPTEVGPQCKDS